MKFLKLKYTVSNKPLDRNILGRHVEGGELKKIISVSPGYPLSEKFSEEDIGFGYRLFRRKVN